MNTIGGGINNVVIGGSKCIGGGINDVAIIYTPTKTDSYFVKAVMYRINMLKFIECKIITELKYHRLDVYLLFQSFTKLISIHFCNRIKIDRITIDYADPELMSKIINYVSLVQSNPYGN